MKINIAASGPAVRVNPVPFRIYCYVYKMPMLDASSTYYRRPADMRTYKERRNEAQMEHGEFDRRGFRWLASVTGKD